MIGKKGVVESQEDKLSSLQATFVSCDFSKIKERLENLKSDKVTFQPVEIDNAPYKVFSLLGYFIVKKEISIVKLLLNDNRVNKTANYNEPIRYASRYGHSDIVKELLKHKEVDPSDFSNFALIQACSRGHLEIVKMLLKHEKVDIEAENNRPLREAVKNGQYEVVRYFLQDSKLSKIVDPSACNNECIVNCCKLKAEKNATDIFSELVKHPKVNPSVLQNEALRNAVWYNNYEIVKLLLNHKDVNPIDRNNICIKEAAIKGRYESFIVLINDKRVISSVKKEDLEYILDKMNPTSNPMGKSKVFLYIYQKYFVEKSVVVSKYYDGCLLRATCGIKRSEKFLEYVLNDKDVNVKPTQMLLRMSMDVRRKNEDKVLKVLLQSGKFGKKQMIGCLKYARSENNKLWEGNILAFHTE